MFISKALTHRIISKSDICVTRLSFLSGQIQGRVKVQNPAVFPATSGDVAVLQDTYREN